MKAPSNRRTILSVLLITAGFVIAFFIFNGLDVFKTSIDLTNENIVQTASTSSTPPSIKVTDSIPDYVRSTYQFIKKHSDAPHGYYGGRSFQNREKRLPQRGRNGASIQYREWDVHPRRDGIDRGAERLVTGSDGSAWYTADHYRSFIPVE